MNIDFIKWMCEKAEGFKVTIDRVVCLGWDSDHATVVDGCQLWNGVYYPLLLQRAIEGVNMERGGYSVAQGSFAVVISDRFSRKTTRKNFKDCESTDQAKESALKYIYEQEMNK